MAWLEGRIGSIEEEQGIVRQWADNLHH